MCLVCEPEGFSAFETDPELLQQLKAYDGFAWYSSRLATPKDLRERRIYLIFGGIGDACHVYVNGQLAGAHRAGSEADKRASFAIRIDPVIDWSQRFQTLMVHVKNESGLGGLYGRIWVVSEKITP